MAAPFWDINYSVEDPGPYYAPGEVGPDGSGESGHNFVIQNPWDTLWIAGKQLPGLWEVPAGRKRFIFTQQVPGAPPVLYPAGYEPLRFSARGQIWTPRMWLSLQVFLRQLMPLRVAGSTTPTGGNRDAAAFDIYHPWLDSIGVKSAVCVGLGPITGAQVKTLSLEFLEYRKGKQAVQQVNQSINVDPKYNKNLLANRNVSPQSGRVTQFTPTQGPQQTPSSAPSLTRTP